MLASLPYLNQVRERSQPVLRPTDDYSIPAQLTRHRVTHLQGTPSLIRTILADPDGRRGLGTLDVLRAPHVVAFVAEVDGTVAAGAMVIVTHGVAGVYWVGTRPEGRGKGLAELCTRAAGNAGFDLGARVAGLQASVMGEPGESVPMPVALMTTLWSGSAAMSRSFSAASSLQT